MLGTNWGEGLIGRSGEPRVDAIIHVGIILNDYHIIHAHGKVRIDTLDHSGIFNADLQKHTHKLNKGYKIGQQWVELLALGRGTVVGKTDKTKVLPLF